MFDKADACLFIRTEKVLGKSIHYFTGVETDLGILLKFKKRQILYLSTLEEKPKVSFPVKDFDFDQVKKDLQKSKAKTIGLHYGELTKKTFDFLKRELKGYRFVNIEQEVTALRTKKTAQEVTYLKKAIAFTEEIIFNLAKRLKSFSYESQAVQFIKQEMIRLGVEESFAPIVASGTNSKNPHYFPKPHSKMQTGFCIVDMGVKYKGYCADITRTFYIGKPKQEEIDFYNKIKNQLLSFEKMVKPGIGEFKADFKMIHLIGHGIGLDVHEYPGVGVNRLEEGICIAMEPAIYMNRYGVRIEDDYQLTKNGVKRLSKSSRDLMIL
ncbi:MAG: aminopeptidase P family protein [Nanoarchaeota archaeon]|nr:aminopeptidase P family protein [Nanoarchaeota archaeon]